MKTQKNTERGANWTLVWAEEFDGPEIDASVWTFEKGFVRNHEAQYYTDRPENARIEDGRLVIVARKEPWPNSAFDPAASGDWRKTAKEAGYTSASLHSRGKFDFCYGRLEVRAKVPESRGTWPAIWTCGRDFPWPRCGEIDVMETVGFEPGTVFATTHWADPATGGHASHGGRIGGVSPSDGFHLYGIEWDENAIIYTFDGRPYNVQPVADLTDAAGFNPFRQPHYLRLNLAIGGDWGGKKGIDDAPFPIRYEIDFVRLYKRVP